MVAEKSALRRAAKRVKAVRSRQEPKSDAVVGGALHANQLDRLIHERVRLGIVSALAGSERMSFAELKGLLRLSDGNLAVHARKLEEAGYIDCSKRFEGRTPRTEYELTAKGRKALSRYLEHMAALIDALV